MALKLKNEYGYNFENLKVLQGGWGLWQDRNKGDAQGYPIETR